MTTKSFSELLADWNQAKDALARWMNQHDLILFGTFEAESLPIGGKERLEHLLTISEQLKLTSSVFFYSTRADKMIQLIFKRHGKGYYGDLR